MIPEGARVSWEGVSRRQYGMVRSPAPRGGLYVQLDNGKYVVAAEESLRIEE